MSNPQPTRRDKRFFRACLDEANASKMSFKLGAVVVKNGKIIGRGRNAVIRWVANKRRRGGQGREVSWLEGEEGKRETERSSDPPGLAFWFFP